MDKELVNSKSMTEATSTDLPAFHELSLYHHFLSAFYYHIRTLISQGGIAYSAS